LGFAARAPVPFALTSGDAMHAADLDDVILAPRVSLPLRARVRVRYRHEGATAQVIRTESGARALFDAPVRAVSKGQVAVFYDGDRVLGGGRIARAIPRDPRDASA
jgi:tRNA-specific 2-thiouridylase